MRKPGSLGDYVNPVLLKELRQELKTRFFVFALFWAHTILACAFITELFAVDARNAPKLTEIAFYTVVSVFLLIILPFRGLGSFRKEDKANELELIFLSRLCSWEMVIYKALGLILQGLLICVSAVPYAILGYFTTGSDLRYAGVWSCGVLLGSSLLICIAVSFSTWNVKAGWLIGLAIALFWVVAAPLERILFAGHASGRSLLYTWQNYVYVLSFTGAAFLVAAQIGASSIAPRGERHSLWRRLMALGCVVLVSAYCASGAWPKVSAGAALVLLLPLTLSMLLEKPDHKSGRNVCLVILGRRQKLLNALFYPGWPSGIYWTLLIVVLTFGAVSRIGAGALITAPGAAGSSLLLLFCGLMGFVTIGRGVGRRAPREKNPVMPERHENETLWYSALLWGTAAAGFLLIRPPFIFAAVTVTGALLLPLAVIKLVCPDRTKIAAPYLITQAVMLVLTLFICSSRHGGAKTVWNLLPTAAFGLSMVERQFTPMLPVAAAVAVISLWILARAAEQELLQMKLVYSRTLHCTQKAAAATGQAAPPAGEEVHV